MLELATLTLPAAALYGGLLLLLVNFDHSVAHNSVNKVLIDRFCVSKAVNVNFLRNHRCEAGCVERLNLQS